MLDTGDTNSEDPLEVEVKWLWRWKYCLELIKTNNIKLSLSFFFLYQKISLWSKNICVNFRNGMTMSRSLLAVKRFLKKWRNIYRKNLYSYQGNLRHKTSEESLLILLCHLCLLIFTSLDHSFLSLAISFMNTSFFVDLAFMLLVDHSTFHATYNHCIAKTCYLFLSLHVYY